MSAKLQIVLGLMLIMVGLVTVLDNRPEPVRLNEDRMRAMSRAGHSGQGYVLLVAGIVVVILALLK